MGEEGQQDLGLSCPECFHSAAAAGAASVPEKSEQRRRGRARTLQTWHHGGLSLFFTVQGLDSSPEVQRAVQSADFPLRRVAGGCARKQPLPRVFPYTKGEKLRKPKEAQRKELGHQNARSHRSQLESCGGLEAAGEQTDHSSSCGGQERTAPCCRLPSTIVVSLVPERSKLQTKARHSSPDAGGTGSQLLSPRRLGSLDTPRASSPILLRLLLAS